MSLVGKCMTNIPIENFLVIWKQGGLGPQNLQGIWKLIVDDNDYISFYKHQYYQEKHNSPALLEVRNKALA